MSILAWLGGNDTGASSKVLALTALGEMPPRAATTYPHDGADFGRCYRLIEANPEAKAGLDKLATDGGPYWKALAARWDEITVAWMADEALFKKIGRQPSKEYRCYELMRSILKSIEDADAGLIKLGKGVSMRWGQ